MLWKAIVKKRLVVDFGALTRITNAALAVEAQTRGQAGAEDSVILFVQFEGQKHALALLDSKNPSTQLDLTFDFVEQHGPDGEPAGLPEAHETRDEVLRHRAALHDGLEGPAAYK